MTAIVPTASPTAKKPTHHLVLTGQSPSTLKIGLILCDKKGNAFERAFHRRPMPGSALKMTTGLTRYHDMMPPWTPVSQENWAGGKGAKDFDRDESMFNDGYQINTTREGEIILAGKPTECLYQGNVSTGNTDSGMNAGLTTTAAVEYFRAYQFTGTVHFHISSLAMKIKMPAGMTIQVGLGLITAGFPASITYSDNIFSTDTNGLVVTVNFTFATPYEGMGVGTTNCLVLKITGIGSIEWRYYNANVNRWWAENPPMTWTATSAAPGPFFTVYAAALNTNVLAFTYKGALYGVTRPDDGTYSKLMINGDAGAATALSTTTSVKLGSGLATHTANDAVGQILKIMSGTGSDQPQNWRIITANDATGTTGAGITVFTVSAFDVAPDVTSVIAIKGSNVWTEITGFHTNYATAVVRDILVCHGAVYFACGDALAMIRWASRNAAGVWTHDWSGVGGSAAEDGTFTFLARGQDQYGEYILGAKGGYPAQTQRATAVDWSAGTGAAKLTWDAAVSMGDLYERITGLGNYGQYGQSLGLKEGSVHTYYEKAWQVLSCPAMYATLDSRTGRAWCVQEPYLYYSYNNTIVRYFNQYLDGVGPDKAEVAIPTGNRYGPFTCLKVYPGLVLGSVDAGPGVNVSTVLAYNEHGWCELYRASPGARIQNIYLQEIDGQAPARLWISEGTKLVWIPMSPDPLNHPSDGYNPYQFCADGYLITAWNYLGVHGVDKLFNSIRVVAENLSATVGAECLVYVSYQVDEGDWTFIETAISAFDQELDLATAPSVHGKRIRFMFGLHTTTGLTSPRIIATVLEALAVYPIRYITDIRFRVGDKDVDLNHKPDKYQDHDLKLNDLETLQADAVPPLITAVSTQIHNKYQRIDAINIDPHKIETETGEEVYIGTATLVEVS